ncbi:ATP-binding protein [Niallia nealsonii]|nr:ATP-binding protein [Niallia nealsonii]
MNTLSKNISKLPFPYFVINNHLEILHSSIPNSPSIKSSSFADYLLIDEDEFTGFLKGEDAEVEMTIQLPHFHYESFYRLYKVEEDSLYHLYCIPLTKQEEHVQKLSKQINKQLYDFHQHMREQKNFFTKTIHLFRDVALSNDYSNNIGKLAAGIAHEIRNPLTTVKGFIQLIKPHLKEIKKERYADIALEEIDRANDIIFDFLNASKPKDDNWEHISINRLITDICTLFESESIMKNVMIQMDLCEPSPYVFFNEKQLKQVLVNIIKNAFEAIEECHEKKGNKYIHVTTSIKNSFFCIALKDNGCGISESGIKELFNPFYTTKGKGTGIGLSVCKKIMEDAGGNLYAESELNNGTIFYVEIPFKE